MILDYGEVLCLGPEWQALRRMAKVFGIKPNRFLDFYVSSRGPYDQGVITAEDYWLSFARLVGVRFDVAVIRQLRTWDTEMWSRINPEMTQWLEMLHRAGLKTALLSNMEFDMVAYARKNFEWLGCFDHQIFSCEVGLIKPNLAIFHQCIRRLAIKPQEALFVDDRPANVDAARATGMRAIRFRSINQLEKDLTEIRFEPLPRVEQSKGLASHRASHRSK